MKQRMSTYLHVLDYNLLPDGTQMLHVNELPPPYSAIGHDQQTIDDDWNEITVDVQPLNTDPTRYGFVISGGTDTDNGSSIVITQIEHCSRLSWDNGRTKLRLFDRISSINGINLIRVTHEEAVQAFLSVQRRPISLRLSRLDPRHVEHIELIVPFDQSNQTLGITIVGGLDSDSDDPGLFINQIDPTGLLASITNSNQLRVGDRLLEIKTNYTSANLQWVSHSMGIQMIRRTCQDSTRITLVVAHRTA